MKFKVGDRVVCHNPQGSASKLPVSGTVVDANSGYYQINPDIEGRCTTWTEGYMELEHIFNSPLYKALS